MKLWEIDWKTGRMYKASNGQILEVDLMGNLVDYSLNSAKIPHKILCNMDFEPYVDWSKVSIDTKILSSEDGIYWCKRYFAKYEKGVVYAFSSGRTSWSVGSKGGVTSCKYAKLVESES